MPEIDVTIEVIELESPNLSIFDIHHKNHDESNIFTTKSTSKRHIVISDSSEESSTSISNAIQLNDECIKDSALKGDKSIETRLKPQILISSDTSDAEFTKQLSKMTLNPPSTPIRTKKHFINIPIQFDESPGILT